MRGRLDPRPRPSFSSSIVKGSSRTRDEDEDEEEEDSSSPFLLLQPPQNSITLLNLYDFERKDPGPRCRQSPCSSRRKPLGKGGSPYDPRRHKEIRLYPKVFSC